MKRAATYRPTRPPRERGTTRAFVLAIVMHVLLAAFLYFGIHWKNSSPTGSEAELWTDVPDVTPSVPQPVAPAPVQPAPPPPPQEDADIALQEAKRRQQEQEQKEAALLADQQKQAQIKLQQQEAARQKELADQAAAQAKLKAAQDAAAATKAAQAQAAKQAQIEAQKKQQQAEQQKQQDLADQQKAQQDAAAKAEAQKAAKAKAEADAKAKAAADQARHARLAALQGAAGDGETTGAGAGTTGSATGAGGNGSPGYAEKVRAKVRPQIVFSGTVEGNAAAIVSVTCAPDGSVLSTRLVTSSGNSTWDEAVINAIQKADPMPRDIDGKAPRSFQIRFRQKD